MNIFVTSDCPVESARALDDKRVIKMILESAQMLSTAIHVWGGTGPYKVTHLNHPCSIWARTNRSNYTWLVEHFVALMQEYTARYGKHHKCGDLLQQLMMAKHLIPDGNLTPFPNCTPHKDMETIAAYRLTMKEKWANDKRKPTWKNNLKPMW